MQGSASRTSWSALTDAAGADQDRITPERIRSAMLKYIGKRLLMFIPTLIIISFVIFFIILMTAVFADVIVPYEAATKTSASERLQSPNAEHWLGTDGRGRDVFARIVHGAPSSLMIGFIVAAATLVIGGFLVVLAVLLTNLPDKAEKLPDPAK